MLRAGALLVLLGYLTFNVVNCSIADSRETERQGLLMVKAIYAYRDVMGTFPKTQRDLRRYLGGFDHFDLALIEVYASDETSFFIHVGDYIHNGIAGYYDSKSNEWRWDR